MADSSPANRKDPLPVFCFKIELPKIGAEAFFKSVGGLKSETEVVPVKEGGANDTTFQLVGSTKWANIVLKKGFSGTSALMDWREKWVTMAEMNRISGTIIQLNTKLEPVSRWKFTRGWPCKWEMTEFDASKSELSIETLEIAHEGIEVVK